MDERDSDTERGTHRVQSLERGLAVIKAFNSGAAELTLSDVARSTGMTRAAARRFLLTLEGLGYVRTDGKYFSLTARVLELGYSFLSSMSLPEVAQPHLERLSAEVHESSSVSILDGTDVVYVARVAVSRIMAVTINVGTRFPAHATSMGHVLLAGLDERALRSYLDEARLDRLTSRTITTPDELVTELRAVREQGWALVDQELEEGLRSIAVPIRDRGREVVAAANISSHASRTTLESMRAEVLPRLRECAARIEADLAVTAPRRVGGG
ncbi:helix-turn-helix domain-containing protein [Haloechinothrix sp. YIM 98757]|uniref:Glycerol operon regulatory protein n=1 Tax=Haloechinothrix aidingensis TaxID=2752311 RepID=A0A838ABM9_9PSEU|nr:IclR family transcriptional regulator C-terminal domain-containing protein [Haloechinothrix aidingensis]MBA0126672.1 helix-turn-helix domain-containing protein [Haloechinothrix aidingensis]